MRVASISNGDGPPVVMTYAQYLQSPEWANRRLAVLERSHGCEACGRPGRREAHHRTYERLGHELLEDLVALCGVCHRGVHQIQKARRCSVEEATVLLLGSRTVPGRAPESSERMPKMSDGQLPGRRKPRRSSGRRKLSAKTLARQWIGVRTFHVDPASDDASGRH